MQTLAALQKLPAAQSASLPQLVGHFAVAPQRNGAHDGVPATPGVMVQVPTLPATAQASQEPAHAVSQQTPSAALPLAQLAPLVAAWPFLRPQVPLALQVLAPVHESGSWALATVTHAPVPAAHA